MRDPSKLCGSSCATDPERKPDEPTAHSQRSCGACVVHGRIEPERERYRTRQHQTVGLHVIAPDAHLAPTLTSWHNLDIGHSSTWIHSRHDSSEDASSQWRCRFLDQSTRIVFFVVVHHRCWWVDSPTNTPRTDIPITFWAAVPPRQVWSMLSAIVRVQMCVKLAIYRMERRSLPTTLLHLVIQDVERFNITWGRRRQFKIDTSRNTPENPSRTNLSGQRTHGTSHPE